MTDTIACPLCSEKDNRTVKTSDQRRYYQCSRCRLIYLDRAQLPQPDEEVGRYRQHRNSLADSGYTNFLKRAILPAIPYLSTDMQGLDYGCGPSPVLAQLLRRDHQLSCDYYDPFFFPGLPDRQYDFIFSTETFEHFFDPAKELEKLLGRMHAGAYLCIMTELWDKTARFDRWWYRRDHTHVCFYHRETFSYIAKKWPMKLLYHDGRSVFVLQKG